MRELALADLREIVGFVPQETFLFSDSLRDNVALARDDAQSDEVDYAVETSQLGSTTCGQLTNGLDTVLGERGVTLSGGQKQRTALARALLKAPPVVVLDDALSHVDTHTEEEILRRPARLGPRTHDDHHCAPDLYAVRRRLHRRAGRRAHGRDRHAR